MIRRQFKALLIRINVLKRRKRKNQRSLCVRIINGEFVETKIEVEGKSGDNHRGAGSGIGRATSLLFAKEGAKVVVADCDPRRAHGFFTHISSFPKIWEGKLILRQET